MKAKGMEGKLHYHDDHPHHYLMFPVCRRIQSVLKDVVSPKSRTVRSPKGWTRRRNPRGCRGSVSLPSRVLRQAPEGWSWDVLRLHLGLERKGRRKVWHFFLPLLFVCPILCFHLLTSGEYNLLTNQLFCSAPGT